MPTLFKIEMRMFEENSMGWPDWQQPVHGIWEGRLEAESEEEALDEAERLLRERLQRFDHGLCVATIRPWTETDFMLQSDQPSLL